MGNFLKKQTQKLASRQASFDRMAKGGKQNQAFKRPGSLNPHKQYSNRVGK